MEMGCVTFLSLNRDTQTSEIHVPGVLNCLTSLIYGVSLQCTMSHDQDFDLVIIDDFKPTGTFSVFPIKITTPELREILINSTPSYATILINGTYIFCNLFVCFLLSRSKRVSNNGNTTHFSSYSCLT